MRQYKVIDIFTSDQAWWQGMPLAEAIVKCVRDLEVAARIMVTKGSQGCYESGRMVTGGVSILSYNMPLRITMVLPDAELHRVLPVVKEMVDEGIVGLHELSVVSHKSDGLLDREDQSNCTLCGPKSISGLDSAQGNTLDHPIGRKVIRFPNRT